MNASDMRTGEHRTRQAIQTLIEIAARWGENREEGFDRRVDANDTDADCVAIAGEFDQTEDVIEVRDLWRAVEVAQSILSQRGCEHLDPAVTDGRLMTFMDIAIYG